MRSTGPWLITAWIIALAMAAHVHGQGISIPGAIPTSQSAQDNANQRDTKVAEKKENEKAAEMNTASAGVNAIPAAVCTAACANKVTTGNCNQTALGASAASAALTVGFAQEATAISAIAGVDSARKQWASNESQAAAEAKSLQAEQQVAKLKIAEIDQKIAQLQAAPSPIDNAADIQQLTEQKKVFQSQLDPPKKKEGLNTDACFSAAISMAQAGTQYASAQTSKDQARQAAEDLAALATSSPTASGKVESQPLASGSNDASSSSGSNLGGGAALSAQANNLCEQERQQGSNTYFQCLQRSGASLSPVLQNPGFQNDFQKVAGLPLDQFIKQLPTDAKPSEVAAAVLGGNPKLGLGSYDSIREKLAQPEREMVASAVTSGNAVYGGGGGRSLAAEGDGDFAKQINGMVGELMAQVNPGEGVPQRDPSGVSEMQFRNSLDNSPAWNAINRGDPSIFEQVTSRYLAVRHRFARMPEVLGIERAPQQIQR